ncbi:MAG: hypothetical protein AAFX03_11840 [Pseudomonadota bacterium]
MSIKKLLAASSVAALLAGGAHAQLGLIQSDPVDPGVGTPTVIMPHIIPEELDIADATADGQLSGLFGLSITTNGTLPPGQNTNLVLTFTNATFTSSLSGGGNEIDTSGGPTTPGGATGAIVTSGGAAGASTVQYNLTTDSGDSTVGAGVPVAATVDDSLNFVFPLTVSSCAPVTVEVTIFETDVAGVTSPIEGGTAELAAPAITCLDAIQAELKFDADRTTLDATGTTATTPFDQFVSSAPTPASSAIPPDTAGASGTATLGVLRANLATGVVRDLSTVPPTAVAPADFEDFTLVVEFEDADGIATASVVNSGGGDFFVAAPAAPSAVTEQVTVVGPGGAVTDLAPGFFTVEAAGGETIAMQNLDCVSASIDFVAATNLIDEDFAKCILEDLVWEGETFGFFDWFADSNGLVNSVLRITGLHPSVDVPGWIVVRNAQNGDAFNGVYPFAIPGASVTGAEFRMNSAFVTGIVGAFGTADIAIVFPGEIDLLNSAFDPDIDRLIAGPSGITAVPFGDGANQDGQSADPTTLNDGNADDGDF